MYRRPTANANLGDSFRGSLLKTSNKPISLLLHVVVKKILHHQCDRCICRIFTEFPNLGAGRLERASSGLAISAHEHALIEHAFEAAQGSGLVQSAFVATHAGASARGCKWTATFFGFVSETIARNLCDVVFAHAGIVLSKPLSRRSLPRTRSAFALQFTDIHLTL